LNLNNNKKLHHLDMQVATHVFALCESKNHLHKLSVSMLLDTGYLL